MGIAPPGSDWGLASGCGPGQRTAHWPAGRAASTLPPELYRSLVSKVHRQHGIAADRPFFGLQFHPEVTHTAQGGRIFEHFVRSICGCEALWTPANIADDAVARAHALVGEDEVLREADAIFIEELRAAGLYEKVSQAFAVFLPVKSVGVVGDARRYEPVIALRAVETIDFMTALGASPLRIPGAGIQPHHQRNRRHIASGLRHFRQAAGDHRVGVSGTGW